MVYALGATGTGRMIGRYSSSPKPTVGPFESSSPAEAKSLVPPIMIMVKSEIRYQAVLREVIKQS